MFEYCKFSNCSGSLVRGQSTSSPYCNVNVEEMNNTLFGSLVTLHLHWTVLCMDHWLHYTYIGRTEGTLLGSLVTLHLHWTDREQDIHTKTEWFVRIE